MSKNIEIAGSSFSGVPAILVPVQGGGQAIFSDPSVTTAKAPDVKNGKIFLNSSGEITTGTSSGSGSAVLETLEVDENGTYTPESGVDGFDEVVVNVPAPPMSVNIDFAYTNHQEKITNTNVNLWNDFGYQIINSVSVSGTYDLFLSLARDKGYTNGLKNVEIAIRVQHNGVVGWETISEATLNVAYQHHSYHLSNIELLEGDTVCPRLKAPGINNYPIYVFGLHIVQVG